MVCNKEHIFEEIQKLIDKGNRLASTADGYGGIDFSKFDAGRAEILTILRYSKLDVAEYVDQIRDVRNNGRRFVLAVNTTLKTIIDQLDNGILNMQQGALPDVHVALENIFNRFHRVARQLRTRYNTRPTLDIKDEYDVQDLLHAMLLLHFDDVRPEEWTPSYAGGSVRMDFLLKNEGIVIEVKKTRETMTAKALGEELLIDREKYRVHPDCKQIYCFVYDPEGMLGNPVGIKHDLEEGHENYIKVFIRPE